MLRTLAHHMGKEDAGRRAAKANIEAWMREYNRGGLDAGVVNASGCGTMVKDYGHMFKTIRTTRKKRRGFRRSPRISPGRDGTWPGDISRNPAPW